MKNVHVIPTDQPSRLHYYHSFTPQYELSKESLNWRTASHIYITSNEEIKEGVNQWYLDKFLNKPRNSGGAEYSDNQNVIILSTNPKLIADGVQAIDDEFLEWFVKNSSCEFVEVNKEKHFEVDKSKRVNPLNGFYYSYKIIIPKVEPKQDWYCPKCKSYVSPESVTFEEIHQVCNTSVIIDESKQDFDVKELNKMDDLEIEEMSNDWETMKQQVKPKQKTLEEIAERLTENTYQNDVWEEGRLKRIGYHKGIIDGANYMAEKMYSEEEKHIISKSQEMLEMLKNQLEFLTYCRDNMKVSRPVFNQKIIRLEKLIKKAKHY